MAKKIKHKCLDMLYGEQMQLLSRKNKATE